MVARQSGLRRDVLSLQGDDAGSGSPCADALCYDMFGFVDIAHAVLELPQSCLLKVPHVRQAFNWDCGLACVSMVLQAAGVRRLHDLASLRALCPTTSIWSIDLAHLLRRFGLDVVFSTITLGADPGLALAPETMRFYMKTMREDAGRVTRLFEEAPAAGIVLQHRSVSLDELRAALLSGRYLAVALVDKSRLPGTGLWAAHTAATSGRVSGRAAAGATSSGCGGTRGAAAMVAPLGAAHAHAGEAGGEAEAEPPGYTGHYIVLCGYAADTDRFVVQDPAADSPGAYSLPGALLDAARTALGTDEDLLLVQLPGSCGGGSGGGKDDGSHGFWTRSTRRAQGIVA